MTFIRFQIQGWRFILFFPPKVTLHEIFSLAYCIRELMEKFGEMNMIRNPSSSRSFPWFLTHIDYVTKNTRKSFGPGWCSTIFNSENLKSFRPQKVLVHIVQRILMWCNFRRLGRVNTKSRETTFALLYTFCFLLTFEAFSFTNQLSLFCWQLLNVFIFA